MKKEKITIGSRGSKLALIYAKKVKNKIIEKSEFKEDQIIIKGNVDKLMGRRVTVRITGVTKHSMFGEVISEPVDPSIAVNHQLIAKKNAGKKTNEPLDLIKRILRRNSKTFTNLAHFQIMSQY